MGDRTVGVLCKLMQVNDTITYLNLRYLIYIIHNH